MMRGWSVIAGLCLLAAAVFLWRTHIDAAFVAATLGVLAWFLNLRNQLYRAHLAARDPIHAEGEDDKDENQH